MPKENSMMNRSTYIVVLSSTVLGFNQKKTRGVAAPRGRTRAHQPQDVDIQLKMLNCTSLTPITMYKRYVLDTLYEVHTCTSEICGVHTEDREKIRWNHHGQTIISPSIRPNPDEADNFACDRAGKCGQGWPENAEVHLNNGKVARLLGRPTCIF